MPPILVLSAVVRADAPKILAALRSEESLRRRIGRLWLEGAAGQTFDYDEKAKPEDRAAAMEKIEKWFQSFGAKTDPTPVVPDQGLPGANSRAD